MELNFAETLPQRLVHLRPRLSLCRDAARRERSDYGAPKTLCLIIDRSSQDCTTLPWPGALVKGFESGEGGVPLQVTGAIVHGSPNQEKRVIVGYTASDTGANSIADQTLQLIEAEVDFYKAKGLNVSVPEARASG